MEKKATTNANNAINNVVKVSARVEYAKSKERKLRPFSMYNNEIKRDVDALYISELREELKRAKESYKANKSNENKQLVDALTKRVSDAEILLNSPTDYKDIQYLKTILERAKLGREDVAPSFIKLYAPECVYNDMFCKLSKVAPENVSETRARYANNALVSFFASEDGTIFKRTIIDVWTCRDLMNLYARAARNRVNAQRAISQVERDAELLARLREEETRANARAEQRRARILALESAENAAKDAISAQDVAKVESERETLAKATEDANEINAKEVEQSERAQEQS